MMSFFAMGWDSANAEAAQLASGLALRLPRNGRTVLSSAGHFRLALHDLSTDRSGHHILPIEDGRGQLRGSVFGHLYSGTPASAPEAALSRLDRADTAAAIASCGEHFITRFWGSYISFVITDSGLHIVADPTSSIPCFYTLQGGVTLVFSHLERCPFLDQHAFRVNDRFLRKLIVYDKIQDGETGLEGVFELMGGYRLEATDPHLPAHMVWDPRHVALDTCAPSSGQAAETLHQVARQVVQGAALSHGHILLNLSGGFDSALVAALLASMDRACDVKCIHFRLRSDDPPEISYAEAVARSAGLQLDVLPVDASQRLPGPDTHPRSVRPHRQFLGMEQSKALAATSLAENRTIFTGQGGDQLFLETRSPLGFADYLRRHGLAGRAGTELLAAARLSGHSIWRVLAETLPAALKSTPDNPALTAIRDRLTRLSLPSGEAIEAGQLFPAWALTPQGCPPAKFSQVASLVHMFQVRQPLADPAMRPVIHPLIAQPLIELCLRYPASLLCLGGVPRGLARRAMRGLVPDEVRLRRSKGNASRFYGGQILTSKSMIADALMEGCLISRGLLSRRDVERFLADEEFSRTKSGRMILIAYTVEAWLRQWES